MGYIKEPSGINFVVDPTPLTAEDRKKISEIIAFYKQTGKKLRVEKVTPQHSRKKRAGNATDKRKKATV